MKSGVYLALARLCLAGVALIAVLGGWPAARAAIPATADLPAVLGPHRSDHVVSELVADRLEIRPGEPWRIGLKLRHDPGWHTYWRNPGDSGLPTLFEPTGPAGSQFGAIVWPRPERLAIGPLANYGYEGEIVLARQVSVPEGLAGPARFEVHAQWLVCREVCIPGEARLALELPVAAGPAQAAGQVAPVPAWSPDRPRFDDAAASAPDPARPQVAGARLEAGRLLLDLPEELVAQHAEFFPYFEAVVTPAADQRLYAAGPTKRQRLALVVADDAPPLSGIDAEVRGGLLVADGRAIELKLEQALSDGAVGELVAVASVRQPSAGGGGGGQSSAGRPGSLLSALGMSSSTPSAGTGAANVPGAGASGAAPVAADGSTAFGSLVLAVAGALVGGLLLNLMPCVFPVISLKVLSFANTAERPATRRRHAFAFAAGVILFLTLLAGLLLVLRAVGQSVGWGFQLQSPVFVAAMSLLFVLIALNLFGVFEIGARLTTIESGGEGSWGHFWAGAVAVLVATPCTAPFMGGAIGFTLGAGPFATLAVFVALGVGMALPYVLLGLVPSLLRWLPRPGPWLEGFRQLLGFPMLATAVWLAWVLMLQTGADGGLRLLAAAVLVGFAAWLQGRHQRRAGSRGRGWTLATTAARALGVIAAAWQLQMIDRLADEAVPVPDASGARSNPVDWRPWSTAAVETALAAGRPVFVDFTAAWCISCQANKKIALEREAVRKAFVEAGVVTLRADWTRGDAAITAELARHGRNGVPLYLFYRPGPASAPRILPELLTPEIVVSAIRDPGPVGLLAR